MSTKSAITTKVWSGNFKENYLFRRVLEMGMYFRRISYTGLFQECNIIVSIQHISETGIVFVLRWQHVYVCERVWVVCVCGGVGWGWGAYICSVRLFRRSKSQSVEVAVLTASNEYITPSHFHMRRKMSDFQNFVFYS